MLPVMSCGSFELAGYRAAYIELAWPPRRLRVGVWLRARWFAGPIGVYRIFGSSARSFGLRIWRLALDLRIDR